MSIKFSFPIIFFFTFFVFINNSLARSGFNYQTNFEIEIDDGVYISEGELINYFDWMEGVSKKAEVLNVEYDSDGMRVEVYDVEKNENNILKFYY